MNFAVTTTPTTTTTTTPSTTTFGIIAITVIAIIIFLLFQEIFSGRYQPTDCIILTSSLSLSVPTFVDGSAI